MPHPQNANRHQSHDKVSFPDRYDPTFTCTALLRGRTVMTPSGPMCDIVTTLQEQVKREYLPYTLAPTLSTETSKNQ